MIIRRIVPLSAAKVMAIVYAAIGFVIGILVWLVGRAGGFADDPAADALFGSGFGVAAVIVLPFVYGAIGFIAMLLIAALYNWAAGVVGGIEIETSADPAP